MQFYTFLETTLVTLVLMPHFIAFFSDEEIPGTPGTLATTFLAFGIFGLPYMYTVFNVFRFIYQSISLTLFHQIAVLNLAFALSVMGFLIMHISLVAGNTTTIEVIPIFFLVTRILKVSVHLMAKSLSFLLLK